ncbi:hypothetical protein PIB30_031360 [Stylosanthes scabra]|uniref:Uncharacterized protein n=1 Tax=Stylosanthes scabra TaxID=79078 RepID=A0ABU6VB11_9FABA|nr:hypothetical protein [Stylosanthes scabra]
MGVYASNTMVCTHPQALRENRNISLCSNDSQRTFPSAKGKDKAYGAPTRDSPRLSAMRAQMPPFSPALLPSLTPSLPLTKRPIPPDALDPHLAATKITPDVSAQSICRRYQRIAARGGCSVSKPKEKVVITISSDDEPGPKLEDTLEEKAELDEDENQEEDPEEDPEEVPQDAEVEEEQEYYEEDPEKVEGEAEKILQGEDDFADYFALEVFDSIDVVGDNPHL